MAPVAMLPQHISLLEYAALLSQIIGTFLSLLALILFWLYRPWRRRSLENVALGLNLVVPCHTQDGNGEYLQKVLEPTLRYTPISMDSLASTPRREDRWDEIQVLEGQVMKTFKRTLGSEHPCTLASMSNLAYTRKGMGRNAEAIQLMEQCALVQGRIMSVSHTHNLPLSVTLTLWET